MRLAVRFSPPKNTKAGSQNTIAQGLIPELHKMHPNMVLFTSNPEVFSHISGLEICEVRETGVSRSMLGSIKERMLDQLTFELNLRKHKCDIVYYPYTHEAILLTFTIPQVITVHDVIPLIFQETFPLMSKQWKFFTIPTLRFSRKIIVVSKNTKQDLVRLIGVDERKVSIVLGGFRERFSNDAVFKQNSYGKYLLYVCSSQYPYKNIFRLLEAFAKLKDVIPHSLVIVGTRYVRDEGKTIETINMLGLNERVFILENLPNDRLCDIYYHAALFVYPSLYEGFGIPPLEAMSYGIPIIAAHTASIPEVCGDAAYFFDPNSVEALANAIILGLSNQQLREQLIARGLERVKMFGWDKTAAGVLDVCRSTLG